MLEKGVSRDSRGIDKGIDKSGPTEFAKKMLNL
jgi:hypothetical protein